MKQAVGPRVLASDKGWRPTKGCCWKMEVGRRDVSTPSRDTIDDSTMIGAAAREEACCLDILIPTAVRHQKSLRRREPSPCARLRSPPQKPSSSRVPLCFSSHHPSISISGRTAPTTGGSYWKFLLGVPTGRKVCWLVLYSYSSRWRPAHQREYEYRTNPPIPR